MSIPSLVFTVAAFLVALGIIVVPHEFGHFGVAKRLGVKVLRFSVGFGPVIWSRRRGETEYAVSALPLGGYVKMLGEDDEGEAVTEPERAFATQATWRRALIVAGGPAMNFIFAFLVYAMLFAAVGAEIPSTEPRVGGIASGSPADHAGLQLGDRVTAVDGTAVATWEALAQRVRDSGGKALQLTVQRDGATREITVTPAERDTKSLFGEDTGKVWLIGIEASHDWQAVSPPRAVVMAAQQTAMAAGVVVQGLALIVRGRVSPTELGGPIAIARAAGEQARAGGRYFLSMLAFLSINLGVLNLLPVPGLDGGHLALFAVEGALGRPLRPRARELAQQVGLLLLLSLMVFVFYNDIHRIIAQG